MTKEKNEIREMMHSIFNDSAIALAATNQKQEDGQWLDAHGIKYYSKKYEKMSQEGLKYWYQDRKDGHTYTPENMKKFREGIKKLHAEGKIKRWDDGLEGDEARAAAWFYFGARE